jgi:hypothetical protein
MNTRSFRTSVRILTLTLLVVSATRAGAQGVVVEPAGIIVIHARVHGYTLGAAFAGRHEKTEGSLEVGKLADLVIVSQNIFDVNPHKIGATKVVTTILGGRAVCQADTK